MSQPFYKLASTLGGFSVGYWSLSEFLFNHSKTTIISKYDYQNNDKLRKKILRRHETMSKWLNVDMSHVKRW